VPGSVDEFVWKAKHILRDRKSLPLEDEAALADSKVHRVKRRSLAADGKTGSSARPALRSFNMAQLSAQANGAFGGALRRYRMAARLSQRALADRADLSLQAVSALESGRRRAPFPNTLERLVLALALTPEERAELDSYAERARRSTRSKKSVTAAKSSNLPRSLASFVGREAVIAEIGALLHDWPLVTVVGTGGVGKTSVAVHTSARVLERWPDGVWFVELAAVREPSLVPSAIAGALHVCESPTRPALASIVAHLQDKQTLLVLDNCEHVIDEVSRAVSAILQRCPLVAVLTTSREALRLRGERVYRVPSLSVPVSLNPSAKEARTHAAVALFTDRARAVDGDFALTDDNAAAVADICRRLDGIPLAIELAAARIRVLSPSQLVSRLDERLSLLTTGDRTALPRQRTMRALIDWSYELLSPCERILFAHLAIFVGGFTLEAASAVCSDQGTRQAQILEPLSSLVDKSLLVAKTVGNDVRYRLLESTREYALEKLRERGEVESLSYRHATTYLQAAEEFERHWYVTPEREWLAQAELELGNWRAALEWSLAPQGDVGIAQRLVGALCPVWSALAVGEGHRWMQAALGTVCSDTPAQVVAQLSLCEAELHRVLGQHKASLGAAERALALASELGDPLTVVRAQQKAGSALAGLGRGSEAEVLLRKALSTARRLENQRLVAALLGELGTERSRTGDLPGARAFYGQALVNLRAIGGERQAAYITSNLAELEFVAGDPEAALRCAEHALASHRALGNDRSVAHCLCNIAAYLVALGRYDEGGARGVEALADARYVQAEPLTVWALQHLAAVLALRPKNGHESASRDSSQAARLLGFVDARAALLGLVRDRTEEHEYERLLAALRGASAATSLESYEADGAAWGEDEAVAQATATFTDSAMCLPI
jgi:predicted ATPase/transcriptional regulator with XRE-family HTH domain